MNLVLNARDAMPFGGELLIGTACVEQKLSSFQPEESHSRRHVMLTVTDSGLGMDEETQRRVFEPFFTTKELGKGTGLGLSIVQGIIAQSGGSIEVRSRPGNGTTFTIYLPEAPDAAATTAATLQTAQARNDQGMVMVVEDEPGVRDYAAMVLINCGYKVIKADNAVEALRLSEHEHDHIDLVLADELMPKRGGLDFLKALRTDARHARLPAAWARDSGKRIRSRAHRRKDHFIRLRWSSRQSCKVPARTGCALVRSIAGQPARSE